MRLRVLAAGLLACVTGCGPDNGPATMEFVEFIPAQPKIGEIVTVRFKLNDERGLPLAGQTVTFKLQNTNPAVSIAPTTVTSLKGSGFAETQLQASTRVASAIVVATAGKKEIVSPPISFAGATPNAGQFTFQCGPVAGSASGGRHAIGAYDLDRGLIAGITLNCIAHVGDRNGDGLPDAVVSFLTEAGTIGPNESTATDVIGNALVLHKTSLPLPKDVDPENFTWTPLSDGTHTGEFVAPLWMEPWNWVANPVQYPPPAPAMNPREPSRLEQIPGRRNKDGTQIRMNPRDNLVTMIAVTTGEEAFIDMNNDGICNNNEPYTDLTEPFVDSNDNGTWDEDEKFIDVNNDRKWNGKNEKWDSSTLIWVQERILWTGVPHPVHDAVPPSPVVSQASVSPPAPIAFLCPPGTAVGGQCGLATPNASTPAYARVTLRLADPWYNSIAQNGDSDGCAVIDPTGAGEDASPVRAVPYGGSVINGGFAFNYPAGRTIDVTIKDSRDPNLPINQQVPKRLPIPWTLPITCTFSASPNDTYTTRIGLTEINGTIE